MLPQISLWSAVAEWNVDTAFAGPVTDPRAAVSYARWCSWDQSVDCKSTG